jgi:hypothetical protein
MKILNKEQQFGVIGFCLGVIISVAFWFSLGGQRGREVKTTISSNNQFTHSDIERVVEEARVVNSIQSEDPNSFQCDEGMVKDIMRYLDSKSKENRNITAQNLYRFCSEYKDLFEPTLFKKLSEEDDPLYFRGLAFNILKLDPKNDLKIQDILNSVFKEDKRFKKVYEEKVKPDYEAFQKRRATINQPN